MSEQPDEPEPEPLVIEITADATNFTRALEDAHSRVFFMTHPDLNGGGPVRPDEEPA